MNRPEVEAELQKWTASGDWARAATLLIQAYGPELFGFLVHMLGDRAEAREVLQQASVDACEGLATFKGRSSFRTWMYSVAYHAGLRHVRGRRRQQLPLSECPELAAAVRTATLPHLRTEAKTALQRIRERLSSEERALLVLRVDRALPWEEVARALLGEEEISDASRLRRATQSVRQQYRRLKEKLAVMLRAEGLWADSTRPAEEANEP